MAESRLIRRSIKQSKRQLYASLIAIVVILFVALNFGPYLIGGLGGFIDKITGKGSQAEKIETSADIQAPTLDALPAATSNEQITVPGRSYYTKGSIELFVNGFRRDQTDLENSQDFKFEDVRLAEGANFIKVRTIIDNKKSDFSDEEQITYNKNAPKLDVSFPADRQSFRKGDQQITMRGTTDADNSINVNGFIAIVDSSGNFTYNYNLSNGDNKVTITATSPAGQQTTKEITVSYSE